MKDTSPLTWNFSSQAASFFLNSNALSFSSLEVHASSDSFEAEEPPTRVATEAELKIILRSAF